MRRTRFAQNGSRAFAAAAKKFSGTAAKIWRYNGGVYRRERIENGSMRKLSIYSIWAGAALYAAIGMLGLLFLSTQPNIAAPADGYGTARVPPNQ
jgi:hypothetical protein